MTQKKTVSVVVPVWNEAEGINDTVAHLYSVAEGCVLAAQVQVVVSDGHPGRTTLRAVQDRRVKCVASPPGRGAQMNAGARAADGDVLFFVHADTRLPAGAFDHLLKALSGGLAYAGAFDLEIDTTGLAVHEALALGVIARFARLRSRLERKPYGDQTLFMTRDDFHRVGGFAEIPVMEDVAMHRRILELGEDIVILPQRVGTSPRRWLEEGMVSRTLRNWRLRLRYALGADPRDLAADYRPRGGERQ